MASTYTEHNHLLKNYKIKGEDTGLPIGSLNPSNDSIQKANKIFEFKQWKDTPNTIFDCYLTSERCIHKNKSGRQCTRQTVIGVQRCWQHLKLHWKIQIKKTRSMGLGVFAVGKTKNPEEIVFTDGDLIADFVGEMIPVRESNKRYKKNTAPYAYDAGNGWIIDPACRRGIGSIVNHKSHDRANARFAIIHINKRTHSRVPRVVVKAQKTIKNGEQIFVSYGKSYRMKRTKSSFTTKNKKNSKKGRDSTGIRRL